MSLVADEVTMMNGPAVQGQEAAKWRDEMEQELEDIRKNKKWNLTDHPVCRPLLKDKWV